MITWFFCSISSTIIFLGAAMYCYGSTNRKRSITSVLVFTKTNCFSQVMSSAKYPYIWWWCIISWNSPVQKSQDFTINLSSTMFTLQGLACPEPCFGLGCFPWNNQTRIFVSLLMERSGPTFSKVLPNRPLFNLIQIFKPKSKHFLFRLTFRSRSDQFDRVNEKYLFILVHKLDP